MGYGFWGRVVEVDLSTRKTKVTEVPKHVYRRYLGGSGLAARILYDQMVPELDPLDPRNPMIFMTGLLTGTPVPSACKTSVCARSPQTGVWDEATVGGYWGPMLKACGYDGILITGKSEDPVYLWITEDGAEIRSAKGIWGLDTYETAARIRTETHPECQVAAIGLAGERMCRIAGIMFGGTDARAAARGGLGALMGSRGLKAVAVWGQKSVPICDRDRLMDSIRKEAPAIRSNAKGLSEFGTAVGLASLEVCGDLPIRNFGQGRWEVAAKISGESLRETIFRKHYGCYGCFLKCGKVVEIGGSSDHREVHGPEYETIAALGSLCLLDDLEAIAEANDLCNRHGLDTISTGATIAFAIEACERGMLSKEAFGDLEPKWGDKRTVLTLVDLIAKREGIGHLLADGTKAAAEAIGKNAIELTACAKGLEFPMHDPRAYVSNALAYATANRGACHLEAFSYIFESGPPVEGLDYDLTLGIQNPEGKAKMVAMMQNYMSIYNALGLCKFLFVGRLAPRVVAEWVECVTGWEVTTDDLMMTGETLFNLKRLYNNRLGISRKDDTLSVRALTLPRWADDTGTKNLPHLGRMLAEYYEHRGWDELGYPKPEKLSALGLQSV